MLAVVVRGARGAIHFARRSRTIRDPTSVRGPGDHDLRAPRGVAPGAARRARANVNAMARIMTRDLASVYTFTRVRGACQWSPRGVPELNH